MSETVPNRRPLASRGARSARRAAEALTRAGVAPDAISAAGIVFAALALAAFWVAPAQAWAWLAAALMIQLRLAANLLDGMVAIEGGRGSALGPIWNEAPDRVEDTAILWGLGIAVGAPGLGLWTALAAVFCAYVRALGGALGQAQDFAGPMAKQHRMAAATLAALLGFAGAAAGFGPGPARLLLAAILVGTLATAARRLRRLAARLKAAAAR